MHNDKSEGKLVDISVYVGQYQERKNSTLTRWQAYITDRDTKKSKFLGIYGTEIQALTARNHYCRENNYLDEIQEVLNLPESPNISESKKDDLSLVNKNWKPILQLVDNPEKKKCHRIQELHRKLIPNPKIFARPSIHEKRDGTEHRSVKLDNASNHSNSEKIENASNSVKTEIASNNNNEEFQNIINKNFNNIVVNNLNNIAANNQNNKNVKSETSQTTIAQSMESSDSELEESPRKLAPHVNSFNCLKTNSINQINTNKVFSMMTKSKPKLTMPPPHLPRPFPLNRKS
eukprot:UN28381